MSGSNCDTITPEAAPTNGQLSLREDAALMLAVHTLRATASRLRKSSSLPHDSAAAEYDAAASALYSIISRSYRGNFSETY